MTTAEPSSPNQSLTPKPGLLTRWSTVPPWVIIVSIVAMLVVGYWIYRKFSSTNSGTSATTNWASQATEYLVSQGYESQTSHEAIHNYVSGQPLTPSQITLVASAIGYMGSAPGVSTDATTTGQLSSAPAGGTGSLGAGGNPAGSASVTSTMPGSPYPGSGTGSSTTSTTAGTTAPVSYWYVPIGVAGWSTTWQGIADQFGVSVGSVQAANSNINVKTTYGRLPTGQTVKVPRP